LIKTLMRKAIVIFVRVFLRIRGGCINSMEDKLILELKARVNDLERENLELVKLAETYSNLDFAWAGNLGRWTWNVLTNEVDFNPLKAQAIGYNQSDLPEKVGYEFFTEKLHKDDYDKTMDSMRGLLSGVNNIYEVEYRIRAKDGSWKWYYDRGAISKVDQEGKAIVISGIVFDISNQKTLEERLIKQNKELEALAFKDGLTGLFNHRVIIEKLTSEINRGVRYGHEISVAMLDIDDFKKVNDIYGHLKGDEVIRAVADTIIKNIRNIDMAGRYGGEEFLIVLPETDLKNAYIVLERIRKDIEAYSFEQGVKVTISGGISDYQGQSVDGLIHEADLKLLEAKRSGKNKIVME